MLAEYINCEDLPSASLAINEEKKRLMIIVNTLKRCLYSILDSVKDEDLFNIKKLVSEINFMIILIQDLIREEALL